VIRVAVIGAGYWGPNLIRNFAACPETRLVAVCDKDRARLEKVLAGYPGLDAVTSCEVLLFRDDVDALAIATPVGTHAPLAIAALRAGKHVLVEKPLATSVRDAEAKVATAKEARLVLMVDHTFVYSGPVRKIKALWPDCQLVITSRYSPPRVVPALAGRRASVPSGPTARRRYDRPGETDWRRGCRHFPRDELAPVDGMPARVVSEI